MSTHQSRTDRQPTDEPDGETAFAASMRPPGQSVDSSDAESADSGEDFEESQSPRGPDATFDGPVLPGDSRAGYDVNDTAGDTDAYRPQ
jgi:hypothetical protein